MSFLVQEEVRELLDCVNRYVDGFPKNRSGKIKIKMQSGIVDKILGFTELAEGEKPETNLSRDSLNETIIESIKRIKYGEIAIIMKWGKAVNIQEEITYVLWQSKNKKKN